MPHLLLIVEPIGQRAERSEAEGRAAYGAMLDFTESLKQRGVLMASNSLQSTANAVRLQVRDGRKRLFDGPFAEAKEMVGGFFLLDVETREQALAIAEECPAAAWCTVEVREVGPCYVR
ncbi:YciI family protein [Caldimonas sp. KR1-144]|uniref:YciI family protein n=1 Tax=Caldimonas sp. KR1-144 TaxID=3400911 RepID=UPI003C0EFCBF